MLTALTKNQEEVGHGWPADLNRPRVFSLILEFNCPTVPWISEIIRLANVLMSRTSIFGLDKQRRWSQESIFSDTGRLDDMPRHFYWRTGRQGVGVTGV